ncbi:MAG: 5-formyltetrahydrofolate cyclo-ligase [Balneolaceae bacterium]|nr:5-formyltetrahydrofolate cyclo-ligase [Balneolaceae bacterium]
MNIIDQKEQIRKEYLSIRDRLGKKECKARSRAISEQLLTITEIEKANIIHSYIPISGRNEVDTNSLVERLMERGKKIFVPKMEGKGTLSHHPIRSVDELKPNSWGVPEPLELIPQVNLPQFDIVIVPMVAGDFLKNRMGYGQGYYDRFLAGRNSLKIGLLYDVQLRKAPLPVEKSDIPLDILITESLIVR